MKKEGLGGGKRPSSDREGLNFRRYLGVIRDAAPETHRSRTLGSRGIKSLVRRARRGGGRGVCLRPSRGGCKKVVKRKEKRVRGQ